MTWHTNKGSWHKVASNCEVSIHSNVREDENFNRIIVRPVLSFGKDDLKSSVENYYLDRGITLTFQELPPRKLGKYCENKMSKRCESVVS